MKITDTPQLCSREDARVLKLTRYFTGIACKRGHVSERLTSNTACLECRKIQKKQHYEKNKQHFSEYRKQWRLDNIQQLTDQARVYYAENKKRIRQSQKKYAEVNSAAAVKRASLWSKNNTSAVLAKNVKRRARIAKAIPKWYGEFDELVWKEAARLVQLRTTITGVKWHADHIIPIHCTTASGFHIANNCQVIPAILNIRKSNTFSVMTHTDWIHQS